MKKLTQLLLVGLLLATLPISAQVSDTVARAQADLDKTLAELAELREQIAAEKLPLNRELREKEARLIEARSQFDKSSRDLDRANLDLANLTTETKGLTEEHKYLSNLLGEYVQNLQSRVHVTELQRYEAMLTEATLARDDADLSASAVYDLQLAAVEASIDRIAGLVGGDKFAGTAIGDGGRVQDVEFVLVGPVAVYGDGGSLAGLATQQNNSLEPRMIALDEPEMAAAAGALVASGRGNLPFDATLGSAQKIAQTQDTLIEHMKKGGVVMIPIVLMATAAFLVALGKLIQLMLVREPKKKVVEQLLLMVKQRDYKKVEEQVKTIDGPTGAMLAAGVEQIHEPKELVEEVMFESMLETRLKLQSYLSFIALAAASAPLLGLLGTVTGIINTFKLITVFGTGDAATLSGGISEALITTKFGLIVAIPSLLLHGYLSRKARRLTDHMEKTAVSFLNRIPPTPLPTQLAPREETRSANGKATESPAVALPVPGQQPLVEGLDH